MDSKEVSREDIKRFVGNGIGNYIRLNREAGDYSQQDICDGICSVSKFSRVKLGERAVDYQTIEAFLSRMKMDRTSYEFVLDEEDAVGYKHRQRIETLITERKYEQAEEELKVYVEKYGTKKLQGQFYLFQSARLEREKEKPDKSKMKELFIDALTVTAKDYQRKLEERKILSDLELECITEIMHCIKSSAEREDKQQNSISIFSGVRREKNFWHLPFAQQCYIMRKLSTKTESLTSASRYAMKFWRFIMALQNWAIAGKYFFSEQGQEERGEEGRIESCISGILGLPTVYFPFMMGREV